MKSKIVLGLLIFVLSCESDNKSIKTSAGPIQASNLQGIWENVEIKVEVKNDSSYLFIVEEDDWQNILQIRPTQSYFYPDQTYRQVFIGLDNSILDTKKGSWFLNQDTLTITLPEDTLKYSVRLQKGMLLMRGQVDWNSDGQKNDIYFGKQRQVSKSLN
ncbi:MAG: hypothetical protein ACO388_06020 [Saprospiraceae bacterium]|jgi:hypothetical protein